MGIVFVIDGSKIACIEDEVFDKLVFFFFLINMKLNAILKKYFVFFLLYTFKKLIVILS